MGEQTGNEIIDAMCSQVAMREQFCESREAANADDRLDPFINGCQPPATCAAHAHASRSDPFLIDFRPRLEIVDEALLIAEHHAPQSTALPKIEFEQSGLLRIFVVAIATGSFADSLAVKVAINGGHDIAFPHERWSDELATVRIGGNDVFSATRNAAMSVQPDDRRHAPLTALGNHDHAGYVHIHTVVKLKSLQRKIAVVLSRNY